MIDRHGIETLLFFGLIALFALFGASARTLYHWETQTKLGLHLIGNLMVSIFVAWLVGLAFWEMMAERPMVLLAATGAAAWCGGDIIDRIALRITQRLLNNGRGSREAP